MRRFVSALTLLHVVISLVALFAGLVVFAQLVANQHKPGWVSLFLWTTVATSVTDFAQAHDPRACVWDRFSHRAGAGAVCTPCAAPCRRVAQDLCDLIAFCSLSERLRRGGAVLPEDRPLARARPDPEGAAICHRAAGVAPALPRVRLQGGKALPGFHGTSLSSTVRQRPKPHSYTAHEHHHHP